MPLDDTPLCDVLFCQQCWLCAQLFFPLLTPGPAAARVFFFERIGDCIFILDMVASFLTTYKEDGVFVLSCGRVGSGLRGRG